MAVDVASLVIRVSSLEAQAAARDLDRLSTASGHADRSARQMSGGFASVGSALKGMVAQLAAVAGLTAITSGFVSANLEMQRLAKGLTAVTGSAELAGKEIEYLKVQADRMGTSLGSLGNAYVSLTAATKGTAMEGQATRAIFESISLAMGKLGKSSADTEGALMAIQQMISKGTVSSEELKQQLGERLPGAFRLAAEAIGVTEQQLGKMLEQGQVVATDLLPKLSQKLLKLYDDGTRIGGMGAEWERVKNAANAFFVELDKGTGITGAIATLLSDVAAAFKGMTTSLAESAGSTGIFATTMASLGETIKTTRAELISGEWSESTTLIMAVAGAAAGMAAIMVTLSGAIGLVNTAVAILNGLLAMNPWTAIVLAIGAVAGALYVLKDEFVTIGTTTATVGEFIRGIWETTAAYVQVAWETFINWISPVINELGTKFQVVGDMIAANWQGAMSMVVSAATTSINVLISLFVSAGKTIGNIIGAIAIAWETKTFSWEAIKNAAAEGVAYEDHLGQSGLNLTKIVNEQSIAIKKKVENIRAVNQVESDYAQLERELAADNEKAANAGKGHVKVINEKTLALGGGAAAHKGAAKAANEQEKALDALIKKYLPARDDAKNLEEATAVLEKAMKDGKITGEEYGKMLKGLQKDYNSVENAAQALIDKYDTEGARTRQLAEDRAQMTANMADGNLKLEGAAAAMDKLTEAEKKNTKEADAWAEVWKNAVKRIDDTFASLWKDLFSGTKSTLESMKNAIASWLAEVAHALLTKPLVVAITTAMTGGSGVAGAAGQAGQAASGVSGLSGFSSIGSMFSTAFQLGSTFLSGVSEGIMGMFSTNMFSTIGTAWGAATSGSAVGAAAGLGVMAAYAAPLLIAGGLIFSKWQKDQEPRYGAFAATTGRDPRGLEKWEWGGQQTYVTGAFGLNFGQADKGSANITDENREIYKAFADVSTALAKFYGEDVSAQIEASLKANSHIMNLSMDVNEAFDIMFTTIVDHGAATGDKLAVVFKAVLGDLNGTAEEMANQLAAGMQNALMLVQVAGQMKGTAMGDKLQLTGTDEDVAMQLINYSNAMKTSGEAIGATIQRMILNVSTFDAALTLTGTQTDATGMAFIEMANSLAEAADKAKIGTQGLMQLQAAYYDHFFTDEEKALKQKEDALKAIAKWNADAGRTGDAAVTTSADFRKYIESLDLTSEAGQKAYVEAMKMVGSFISLDDALKRLGDTAPDVIDKFEAQRKAMRDLADQLDPTDPLSQSQRDAALAALQKAGYQGSLYDAKGIAEFLRALAALDDAGGEAGAELQKFIDTFTGVFDELARIAEERAGLEMRLMELTGTAAEILAYKRKLELEATDASNRALLMYIYALEDAKAAAEAAEAARRAAYDKEVQAINEYNAAAQQAANEANAAAREALQAMQQAAEAAYQTANSIAQAWLEALSAVGLEAEAKVLSRKLQSAAMDPALRSVYAVVWQIQDAAEKAAAQGDLAIQALGYLDRDDDAQAAQRRMQRAATDPSLRAMQDWVWQLEDAREAADKAGEAIQTLIDSLKAVGSALDDTIKSITDLINGSSPTALAQTRQAAQRDLAAQLAAAKTGKMPTTESLEDTLATLGKDPSAQFGDRTAYLRDLGRTRGQLASLKGIVDKQIPIEEQNLEALKKLPVALYPNFEAIVASIGTTGADTGDLLRQATAAVDAAIAAMKARDDAMDQSIKDIVPALKEIPPYIENVQAELVPLQTLAADMAANIGAIDLNVDGMVSYEEFAAFFGDIMSEADMQTYFDIFDSNGDGMINRLELIKANTAPLLTIVDNLANKFATIDLNVDGTVTWDEFNAFFGKFADKDQLAIWYNAIDTNGNGTIEKLEAINAQLNPLAGLASSIVQGMSKIDLNIDGMVSYDEFTALFGGLASDEQMAGWFAALDLNGDNILDRVELIKGSLNITQALAQVISDNLASIDTDLDGMVSYEEYAAFFGPLATEEELAKGFALLDKNENGILSKMELQYATLGSLAAAISKEMAKIDLNVNGTVEYSEFEAFFGKLADKTEMQDWFDRLDTDQNGILDAAELTAGNLANGAGVLTAGQEAYLRDTTINTANALAVLQEMNYFVSLLVRIGGKSVTYTGTLEKRDIQLGESLLLTRLTSIDNRLSTGISASLTASQNDYLRDININTSNLLTVLQEMNYFVSLLVRIGGKSVTYTGTLEKRDIQLGESLLLTRLTSIDTNIATIKTYLYDMHYYLRLLVLTAGTSLRFTGTVTDRNIVVQENLMMTALNSIKDYLLEIINNLGTSRYSGMWYESWRSAENLKRIVNEGGASGGGYATGGIATGSLSGYQATLHGTEAVIPLGDGNSVTAHLTSPLPNYIAQEAGDSPALRQALAELQEELAALRGDQRAIGAATVGELKDHNKRERKRDVVPQVVEVAP